MPGPDGIPGTATGNRQRPQARPGGTFGGTPSGSSWGSLRTDTPANWTETGNQRVARVSASHPATGSNHPKPVLGAPLGHPQR
ncbi:hypothetical protein GCM10020367_57620 [Streptomyces sannanensis]|uniref:Uncharacterized protein n=1 Tax=Streptomyces sannanensis TaxID=285536 RepID=A0ABP6SKQ4_9ACTN